MSGGAVSWRPGAATSAPWMARALVRTGCPAEGTAAAGRQDTATRRSPRRLGLFAARHNASMTNRIRMVAFAGYYTLWRSQDFFTDAKVEFERIRSEERRGGK